MSVILHLSSGEKYTVNNTTREEVLNNMATYNGGHLNFLQENDNEKVDSIMISHIVRISEL